MWIVSLEKEEIEQHFPYESREEGINKLWIKFHHFSHCEAVLKAMDTSYNIGNEMDQFNQYMYKVKKDKFKTKIESLTCLNIKWFYEEECLKKKTL